MSRVSGVNSTDVRAAVELACRTMGAVFNRHDHDRPYFRAQLRPRPLLSWHSLFAEAHVPGRHLNALAAAHLVLGLPLDEAVIDKHAAALFFSFSGELPLPLNRARVTDARPGVFLAHNIREGLHGLHALVQLRGDERAFQTACRAIDFINRYWTPREGWAVAETPWGLPSNHLIIGIGRSIGPLVKFYRSTGHVPALDLAQRIAAAVVPAAFPEDGAYHEAALGPHVHSVTSTLSSLAQLAEATGDGALLARAAAFYDHGLWQVRDGLGWVIESTRADANPDRGETNSSGDLVETALILGLKLNPAYLDDAERIVRAHLLPAQLRALPEGCGGGTADRLMGAWGFPAPYGHQPVGLAAVLFNLDIVGGTAASLCEAARRAATFTPEDGHRIHCLLDADTPALRLRSPYRGEGLDITFRRAGRVALRFPAALEPPPPARLRDAGFRPEGAYWVHAGVESGQRLTLPLTPREQVLSLRHRQRDLWVRLKGDAVTAMENPGADLTFFEDLG